MNSCRRIICFSLLFTGLLLCFQLPAFADKVPISLLQTEYGIIAGEWQRTDGGYLITVNNVQTDGKATVKYFNPKPIHVALATISRQEGLIKLFIKFQDKGYEGSMYTLYYYAEKDALAGFYYQAVMDRTFKVIFMRKTK